MKKASYVSPELFKVELFSQDVVTASGLVDADETIYEMPDWWKTETGEGV